MNQKNRFSMFALIIVISLLTNAVWTVSARADDGAPPPPQTPSGDSTTQISSSSQNTIANVPTGTAVVVLDRSHKRVPLATQAAADAIASGDPIWCPTGVAPKPGLGGCSATATYFNTPVTGLLALISGKSVNGTIWIESLYSSGLEGGPIILDSGTLGTTANFSLTLKGGWNGISGSTLTDPLNPSTFNVPLNITNWNADVTLSDIVVTGIATAGSSALAISTSKNITLTRINVHDNNGTGLSGASLDNTFSGGNGNVTVSSSQFNHNNQAGLNILSIGTITLSNIIADNNQNLDGAYITNDGGSTPKNVTMTGDNEFNGNFFHGLYLLSNGAITVNDLTASGNGNGLSGVGAFLQNTAGTAAVTLTGTNIFTEDHQGGLYISSHGAIKANNLIANSNTNGTGAALFNFGASTAQPVTLTGTSQFKYNNDYGLNIDSNGLITVNNITASYNKNNRGASLFNEHAPFSSGVTMTGTNIFNGNYMNGLDVESLGTVILNNVTADDNGLVNLSGFGVYLVNTNNSTKSVTLSGTNEFNHNYQEGLVVASTGKITLSNITANGSVDGNGASIVNNNTGVASAIILTGTNNFNNNFFTGLNALSLGAITTNNLTANGNGLSTTSGYGANLDNCSYGGSGCAALTAQPVTMKGSNEFNDNLYSGLIVSSRGLISVNSATANDNGITPSDGYGLSIDNCQNYIGSCTGSGSIVITGSSILDSNYNAGAQIITSGTVSLSNITASNNKAGKGLAVDNTYSGSLTPKNVTLSGTNVFDTNWTDGVNIGSYGIITMSNVTANDNGQNGSSGSGASLSNSSGTLVKDVILTGINTFNHNYSDGLDITSLGNIKVSSVNAGNNLHGFGAFLNNQFGSLTTGVTLSGTNTFNTNYGDGLDIHTHGAVTVNNLTASENGLAGTGKGANINNPTGTPHNVTLTGTNIFDHNQNTGLEIDSLGSIKISNLNASYSVAGYGVDLDNVYGPSTSKAGVTLTGTSVFNSNHYSGLIIQSYGAITINTTNLTAGGNGIGASFGYGVDLYNGASTAVTPSGITMNGANTLNGNYSGGLSVVSKGSVLLHNLTANGNTQGNGANIDNSLGSANVTLTGTNNFNDNQFTGLGIFSKGTITLNNITASNNGPSFAYGIYIRNDGAATPLNVKLTGTNTFNGNQQDGANILSLGTIITNNLTATGNGQNGITFVNSTGTAGVTMTGVNTLSGNNTAGYGGNINSNGIVSLTKVTADGNTHDGLLVYGTGTHVTLTCGSFTNNGGYGLRFNPVSSVTLIGVVSSGNGFANITSSVTPVIVRNCPLP